MYQTLKTDDICIKQNLLFIISYYFYIFFYREIWSGSESFPSCLLYTSDAADDMQCVDLGGRRIIKK